VSKNGVNSHEEQLLLDGTWPPSHSPCTTGGGGSLAIREGRSRCHSRSSKKETEKNDDVRDRTVAAGAWAWGWCGNGSERTGDAEWACEPTRDRKLVDDWSPNVLVVEIKV